MPFKFSKVYQENLPLPTSTHTITADSVVTHFYSPVGRVPSSSWTWQRDDSASRPSLTLLSRFMSFCLCSPLFFSVLMSPSSCFLFEAFSQVINVRWTYTFCQFVLKDFAILQNKHCKRMQHRGASPCWMSCKCIFKRTVLSGFPDNPCALGLKKVLFRRSFRAVRALFSSCFL